jgi:hypothetical protein
MHERLEIQIHFDVETLGEMLSPIILDIYVLPRPQKNVIIGYVQVKEAQI